MIGMLVAMAYIIFSKVRKIYVKSNHITGGE